LSDDLGPPDGRTCGRSSGPNSADPQPTMRSSSLARCVIATQRLDESCANGYNASHLYNARDMLRHSYNRSAPTDRRARMQAKSTYSVGIRHDGVKHNAVQKRLGVDVALLVVRKHLLTNRAPDGIQRHSAARSTGWQGRERPHHCRQSAAAQAQRITRQHKRRKALSTEALTSTPAPAA
jgi:hypothetical protein